MSKKVKNKDTAKNMIEYTARDYGQEYIMKKKMWRAIILFLLTLIALIVFIALFINEKQTVQETYRKQYRRAVTNLGASIDDYQNADANDDLWYRMIVSDAADMKSFIFLIDEMEEEQKSINGLYTTILKYPEQSKKRMKEIRELVQNLEDANGDAYDKINEFVDTIELKGY